MRISAFHVISILAFTCHLSAVELLDNPAFDTDLKFWTPQVLADSSGMALVGEIEHQREGDDGFVRLKRKAAGDSTFTLQIYQRIKADPGKRYLCRFSARSPNQAWVAVLLMRDEGDYVGSTPIVYQPLGPTWTTITLPLAPPEKIAGPLRINFSVDDSASDKIVEITSVSIEPVE
jgi:hypothetical protein